MKDLESLFLLLPLGNLAPEILLQPLILLLINLIGPARLHGYVFWDLILDGLRLFIA